MAEIETEFLFEMYARLNPSIDVGPTPNGHRSILLTPGGHFEGPKLKGEVMAGTGGDWALIRADGVFALDVRVCLKTDDGAILYMTYGGRGRFKDEAQMAAVLDFTSDDPVPGSEYYFRTTPVFETSDERYAWLNGLVCVSTGELGRGGVTYQVHAIL